MLRAACLALILAMPALSCPPMPGPGRELAFPIRTDPVRHWTLVLTRPAGENEGRFEGTLDIRRGRCLAIPGPDPDQPENFFRFRVRAVLFRPGGIAILYDSRQIGPMHGIDSRAIAVRIEGGSVEPQPALERRLERLARNDRSNTAWVRAAARVLSTMR